MCNPPIKPLSPISDLKSAIINPPPFPNFEFTNPSPFSTVPDTLMQPLKPILLALLATLLCAGCNNQYGDDPSKQGLPTPAATPIPTATP
jgi:hypothetical protein